MASSNRDDVEESQQQQRPTTEENENGCEILEEQDVRGLARRVRNNLNISGVSEARRILRRCLEENNTTCDFSDDGLDLLDEDLGQLCDLLGQWCNNKATTTTTVMTTTISLYLSWNKFTTLPHILPPLLCDSRLENLYLNANCITNLPDSFSLMKNLKCLDLSNNKLQQLPPCVLSLTKLEKLYLHDNVLLSWLPPQMASSLTNLRTLCLSRNEELPEEMRKNVEEDAAACKLLLQDIRRKFGNHQ